MVPHDWAGLVLSLAAGSPGDWIALEHGDTRVGIRALAGGMLATAAALDDGGDRAPVAVSDPDPIAHTLGLLGAVAAGRPVLTVDPKHPQERLADAARRAGATTAIGRPIAGLEQVEPTLAAPDEAPPAAATPGDAIGSILLTSGSTGEPKLVLRTREADLHAAMCLRLSGFPIEPGDRHWLAVPYATAPFLTLVMGALFAGATAVFARFDREAVGDLLAEHHISSAYLVPTMLRLARERDGLQGPGWDGMRAIMTGGERLDEDTARVLLERFPGRVFCAYGMTECPRLTQASFEEIAARPGTVGRTIPLRHARVVDVGTDTPLPAGQEGEVLVAGPDLYRGYLGEDPVGDWHRTGDLGRLDEDGYLSITGRASSVVKVGGNRVSTEEVAVALRAHPAVAQAAVIAVDDARFTTRLEAFAVLRDEAGAVDRDAITAWLAERLASYQVPRGLTLLDDLPVDSSGKLSLSTLRAMVGG